MPNTLPDFPSDVPWTLIAASPDMMGTQFCAELPTQQWYGWRSSLAIFAYEPELISLPSVLCNQRVTFLRVTANITGYQPSAEETRQGYTAFSDLPPDQLDNLLGQYFSCTGALLSVSVFPGPDAQGNTSSDITHYPHIIEFEPKTRDYVQSTTQDGEILTASSSDIKIGRGQSVTDTTETGVSASTKITLPLGGGSISAGGVKGTAPSGSAELSGSLTRKWGDTTQDTFSTTADASTQLQQKYGTTTKLSQLYHMLTGYHVGTNRAIFLMLSRLGTLQAPFQESIVNGMRYIEGVQEFFLIVARPNDMMGLSIQADLDTSHLPENTTNPPPPQAQYLTTTETESFTVDATAPSGTMLPFHPSGQTVDLSTCSIEGTNSPTYTAPAGWSIDTSQGDSQWPGVHDSGEISGTPGDTSKISQFLSSDYNVQVHTASGTVTVLGTLTGGSVGEAYSPHFRHTYTVFLKSTTPTTPESAPTTQTTITSSVLITSRQLCTSLTSTQDGGLQCPSEVVHPPIMWQGGDLSIVDERKISIPTVHPLGPPWLTTLRQMSQRIRSIMVTSWRMPSRRPLGTVGFLDSDYFKEQVMRILPSDRIDKPIAQIPGLHAQIVQSFEPHATAGAVLGLDLATLVKKTGLSYPDAVKARRQLLGL